MKQDDTGHSKEKPHFIKPADIFIIFGIAAFAVLLFFFFAMRDFRLDGNGGGRVLTVTVNGDEMGTYSLAEDRTINIGDTNICEIKDGKARMIYADCPDKSCVHSQSIGSAGETIVCLPNRVILQIKDAAGETETKEGLDSVAY